MKKIFLAALAIFAFVSLAFAIGDVCSPPGNPSGCSGGSPPYSGDFCINFTMKDKAGAWAGQFACNCLKDIFNGKASVCQMASDCCPGLGCDLNGRCTNLKGLNDACDPGTQNCCKAGQPGCSDYLYCQQAGPAGGLCKPRGGAGMPCARNLACVVGLVCGEGHCRAPYQTGQDCTPAALPEDEVCATSDFCKVGRDANGKITAKCEAKHAVGEFCDDDRQCKAGIRCWNPPGAVLTRKCMQNIGNPNIGACYAHADCYSEPNDPNKCNAYGRCRQFIMKNVGTQCAGGHECLSEKCVGGVCEYRGRGEECGDELQCLPDLDRIVDLNSGRAYCDYRDAGSSPVVSRMPPDLAGSNAYSFSVKVKNEGRDPTDNTIDLTLQFLGKDGSVLQERMRIIPPLLQPGAEYSTTDSVTCPQNGDGFYVYRASLSGTYRPRLNVSLVHSRARETAEVPVQCGGCARNNGWLPAALVAMLAGGALVALMFMAGYVASSQGLKAHAFEELGALLVGAILVGLLATSVQEVDEQLYKVACRIADPSGASCMGDSEPRTLALEVANRNNNLAVQAMGMAIESNGLISAEASKSGFCSMLGVGLSVGGCSSWGAARGPIVQSISAAGFASADQHSKIALLSIACTSALALFMPLGLVLRAFRLTRGAGSFIIALSLALYMVFPVAIVAADSVVNSFLMSPQARSDPKLGQMLAPYGAANIREAPMPAMLTLWNGASCNAANPDEGNLRHALDRANSGQISDAALVLVMLRGPFETLFAIALTLVAARAFASALGTEIEVSHLARLS